MQLREAYRRLAEQLEKAGIEEAGFEARQLLYRFAAITPEKFLQNQQQLSQKQWEQLTAAVLRRIDGYPLQYLLGEWEFFGLPFLVGEGVLIPRQDTETLCEYAIDLLKGKKGQKVIDLCSGSGCIAITVAHFSDASHEVFALEKSGQAIGYLKKNRERNHSRIQLIEADVLEYLPKNCTYDMILSNPPYLNDNDINSLQREVSFEPKMALYADENGYAFYRKITERWKQVLQTGGILIYEVGIGQAEVVAGILQENGFSEVTVKKDLCGVDRVVSGRKLFS